MLVISLKRYTGAVTTKDPSPVQKRVAQWLLIDMTLNSVTFDLFSLQAVFLLKQILVTARQKVRNHNKTRFRMKKGHSIDTGHHGTKETDPRSLGVRVIICHDSSPSQSQTLTVALSETPRPTGHAILLRLALHERVPLYRFLHLINRPFRCCKSTKQPFAPSTTPKISARL